MGSWKMPGVGNAVGGKSQRRLPDQWKMKRKLHLGIELRACVRTVFCKRAEDRGQARFEFGFGIPLQELAVKAALRESLLGRKVTGRESYWGERFWEILD